MGGGGWQMLTSSGGEGSLNADSCCQGGGGGGVKFAKILLTSYVNAPLADSGRPPVPVGQPRPYLVQLWLNNAKSPKHVPNQALVIYM